MQKLMMDSQTKPNPPRRKENVTYRFKGGEKGFTIIELLITVVIIAILAGIAIPMYSSYASDAKASESLKQLQALITYAQGYMRAHPDNWSATNKLLGKNADGTTVANDDWVEGVIGNNSVYFHYDYDGGNSRIRVLGKADPFDTAATFTENEDTITATLANDGSISYDATGKLESIKPD